jgi:hypothetical protein
MNKDFRFYLKIGFFFLLGLNLLESFFIFVLNGMISEELYKLWIFIDYSIRLTISFGFLFASIGVALYYIYYLLSHK